MAAYLEARILNPSAYDDYAAGEYDNNADSIIDINEVLEAISDYFAGEISIQAVLDVRVLYFQEGQTLLWPWEY